MRRLRIILRTLTVVASMMLAAPNVLAQSNYDYEDESMFEDFGETSDEVDSLRIQMADSTVKAAMVITPEELDSPMMNIIEVAEVTPTTWDKIVEWVMNHLFISTLLANLLIAGLAWLFYRVYSALT
ncbi:MAG: hypothetical protein J6S96_01805 [Muribaculaceae bacterium]|nr:hypothetical protein [Muribaculaceae bacterium]